MGVVAPLVGLLVFDLIVALVYAVLGWFEFTLEPRLVKIMVGLVLLINLVIVILFLLALLGVAVPHMK